MGESITHAGDSPRESSVIAGRLKRLAPADDQARNRPLYNAALKQRGPVSIWLDADMVWIPPPTGKRGRRREFRYEAIQSCLTLNVMFGVPLRQTAGFVGSLSQLVGPDWAVPDFSTLCRIAVEPARRISLWIAPVSSLRGNGTPASMAAPRRPQAPDLAQDTYRDRRRYAGGAGGRGHLQQCCPLSAASCGCACRAMDGADITGEAASRPGCIA